MMDECAGKQATVFPFELPSEVVATISLSALAHNVEVIRAKAPNSKIMAMVKADGYGHGLQKTAFHLQKCGVDALGVARLSEGVALRQAGIHLPIVLLEGVWQESEFAVAARMGLQLVLNQMAQLDHLEAYCETGEQAEHHPLQLWLKLDSGMHRLGFFPCDLTDAHQRLQRLADSSTLISPEIGLLTHFACSDELDNDFTARQLGCFNQFAEQFELCSLANSAAIFAWPETHSDWNRPGIALYGVSPMMAGDGRDLNLKPVMTLRTKVIAVRSHQAGEPVGYGCRWVSERDTVLGVVAIGYGDGYPRHAPSGTPVLIGGRCYPLVGRVSMDKIVVDLGVDSPVAIGDEVILWGDGLPIERIAAAAGTIGYELLCGVTCRVKFVHSE